MKIPFLLLIILVPVSLLLGSVSLPPNEVWQALCGNADTTETAHFIVFESRLPQTLTAILSGAALAVCGLIMQTLFSNPLADPSLLGVNSGASLGAAIALLAFGGGISILGTGISSVLFTVIAAFAGACAVIGLLLIFSSYLKGNLALLVAGVMLSFSISAVISMLNFFATAQGVRSFVIWGLGNFSGVSLSQMPLYAILILIPLSLLFFMVHSLNALLLGADYATNLGIQVKRTRTLLLLITGFLTAVVTALCGPISFIGLAVPHMARLLMHTANHRRLLPGTLILGADVALLSLILSHLPGENGTLPLAAITPLMGVPVVLYILMRKH